MTTSDPPDRQPKTPHGTVKPQRLDRIGAAGWLKSASRPEERADRSPVGDNRLHEQPRRPHRHHTRSRLVRGVSRAHRRSHPLTCRRSNLPSTRSRSAARSRWRASAARGLARMTSRLPAGRHPVRIRATSRSRRRKRFLITAPPTRRDMTNPILGEGASPRDTAGPSRASR